MHDVTQKPVKTGAEILLEITASLANATQRAEDFRRIPALVGRAVGGRPVSAAVIDGWNGETRVLLSASAGRAAVSERDLAAIHEQIQALEDHGGHRAAGAFRNGEIRVAGLAGYPLATVLTGWIDERHHLLLVVHRMEEQPPLSGEPLETLGLVARQLGRCLECLMIWLTRPRALGDPFDQLTNREWTVLRRLDSEGSEKEVAGQLGMSPHTLHAHIKSIYRKVGVRGRLPLLYRVDHLMRSLRQRKVDRFLAAIKNPLEEASGTFTVGTGRHLEGFRDRQMGNAPTIRTRDFQATTKHEMPVELCEIA
jgi:hypothetical protein